MNNYLFLVAFLSLIIYYDTQQRKKLNQDIQDIRESIDKKEETKQKELDTLLKQEEEELQILKQQKEEGEKKQKKEEEKKKDEENKISFKEKKELNRIKNEFSSRKNEVIKQSIVWLILVGIIWTNMNHYNSKLKSDEPNPNPQNLL